MKFPCKWMKVKTIIENEIIQIHSHFLSLAYASVESSDMHVLSGIAGTH